MNRTKNYTTVYLNNHGQVQRGVLQPSQKQERNMNLSICTYSKNRLKHTQQAVPNLLNITEAGDEIVFVDYSCQEGSGKWVKSLQNPKIKVIYVDNRQWWHAAHARNCAAVNTKNSILVFMDIDNIIPKELLSTIRNMPRGQFYALIPGPDISGFCAMYREDFFKINGYEEAIVGHYYEDTNMYRALDLATVKRIDIKIPVRVLDPNTQVRILEAQTGDIWSQNEAITNVLRQKHLYRNNVSRNWALDWHI